MPSDRENLNMLVAVAKHVPTLSSKMECKVQKTKGKRGSSLRRNILDIE